MQGYYIGMFDEKRQADREIFFIPHHFIAINNGNGFRCYLREYRIQLITTTFNLNFFEKRQWDMQELYIPDSIIEHLESQRKNYMQAQDIAFSLLDKVMKTLTERINHNI